MGLAKNSVNKLRSLERNFQINTSKHHSGHAVHFYGEDASLLDSLSTSVIAALEAGDAVVIIATKAHRDGLAKRLKAKGMDTISAREQGTHIRFLVRLDDRVRNPGVSGHDIL